MEWSLQAIMDRREHAALVLATDMLRQAIAITEALDEGRKRAALRSRLKIKSDFLHMKGPPPVTTEEEKAVREAAVRDCETARRALKPVADHVRTMVSADNRPEVNANIMLAYRHLEDASMRLGKAIQAADDGISVYDRSQVPGA